MFDVFVFVGRDDDPIQFNLVCKTILSGSSNQLIFFPLAEKESLSARDWMTFNKIIKGEIAKLKGNPTIHLFFEVDNACVKEMFFLSQLDKKIKASHAVPYTSNKLCVSAVNAWYKKNQTHKGLQSTLSIEAGNLLECVYYVAGAVDPEMDFSESLSFGAEHSGSSEEQASSSSSIVAQSSTSTESIIHRHLDSVFDDSTSSASEPSNTSQENATIFKLSTSSDNLNPVDPRSLPTIDSDSSIFKLSTSSDGLSSVVSSSSSRIYSESSLTKLIHGYDINQILDPLAVFGAQSSASSSSEQSQLSEPSMTSARVTQGFFQQLLGCCQRHNQVEDVNFQPTNGY